MRTIVQIYCWIRWPVLGVLAALWFSCPLSAMMTNVALGLALPSYVLANHGSVTNTEYMRRGFLAIGAFTAVALLAIGALALFQFTLGWYTTNPDFALGTLTPIYAWILGGSTLFQVLCFIPALEDLRQDMIDSKGDIDI